MNKVIIKRNSGKLTKELFNFGCQALDWFQSDLLSEKYGKDWCICHYGYQGKHAITKLNKSGTITITVHT